MTEATPPYAAYPLHWPLDVPRRTRRSRADFHKARQKLSMAQALDRLQRELRLLGASGVVVSSNVAVRLDGLPYANQATPKDPGVAVYFRRRSGRTGRVASGPDAGLRWESNGMQTYCFPCDRWDRPEDNVAAIAKHLEALRGMDRWGVGTSAQAYAGYAALPPPSQEELGWRNVYKELVGDVPVTTAEAQYLRGVWMTKNHPDHGGDDKTAARLNEAYRQAKEELG